MACNFGFFGSGNIHCVQLSSVCRSIVVLIHDFELFATLADVIGSASPGSLIPSLHLRRQVCSASPGGFIFISESPSFGSCIKPDYEVIMPSKLSIPGHFPFFNLPSELRLQVYTQCTGLSLLRLSIASSQIKYELAAQIIKYTTAFSKLKILERDEIYSYTVTKDMNSVPNINHSPVYLEKHRKISRLGEFVVILYREERILWTRWTRVTEKPVKCEWESEEGLWEWDEQCGVFVAVNSLLVAVFFKRALRQGPRYR
ncbi:hypothetical protein BJ508DRAFT_314818 [Ascobolus immersus RN42]|uniref:F-box domain-containing protein n=1 Tax=Ascobolus immersus RN42 TaxID=1160509 RepID=A0A3N4HI01_ASCIM|nr:hypothetical protein BJ508DRAFT_314818 [Ascobolus immersus RN42]